MANNKKGFPVTEPILTPEVRLAFAQHVMTPETKTKMNSEETYEQWSAALLMPKDGTDFSAIKDMIQKAVLTAWPDPADRPRKFNVTLKDSDSGEHTKDGVPPAEKYDGFAGTMSLNAVAYKQPGIVHQRDVRTPITDPSEVYSGCYGIAQISAQAYKSQAGCGVRIFLLNFMKTRDGEMMGGGSKPKAEDAFAAFVKPDEKGSTGEAFDGLF